MFIRITDSFSKPTQVVSLQTVTACTLATAFSDELVFKDVVPRSFLWDNGPQFKAKLFHSKWRILLILNL